MQLMPGISAVGEGSSGFIVRGGGPDQNLVLLDEATVYNPSHLLGFFSVFNSDAIKDLDLYKGVAPSKFGGRASSIMDISMRDGDKKEYKFTGGVGIISAKLTAEGPIKEGESSFIVSARRTYADMFLIFAPPSFKGTRLYFYDVNAKANFKLSEKDKLFVSGYFGKDVLSLPRFISFEWGNATSTIRWNRLITDKLFMNTTFIFSKYNYEMGIETGLKYILDSDLSDLGIKQDYTLYTEKFGEWNFGFGTLFHTFTPGINVAKETAGLRSTILNTKDRNALESNFYIGNTLTLMDDITINYGARLNIFNVLGGDYYSNIKRGKFELENIDTTSYSKFKNVKTYFGLEPRVSVSYALDDSKSIKLGYAKNHQYLHLLSNSTTGSPLDIWIPTSNIIKPQISDQVSLGYFFNFLGGKYEASTEVFYKWLDNQIDFRPGADILAADAPIESKLFFGKGRSYGAEFFLKKTSGKLTGWVSYTLSKSSRKFDDINKGIEFPYRYDKTHDLAVVLNYKLSKKHEFSLNWVFATGNAVTFPTGKYEIMGSHLPVYDSRRNSQRMPNYHRMDVGYNYYIKRTNESEMYWSFSIYNLYFKQNPWSIDFKDEDIEDTNGNIVERKTVAEQTSLFPIVPSVSFNFKF